MKLYPWHRKYALTLVFILPVLLFYAIIEGDHNIAVNADLAGREAPFVLILDAGHGGADGGAVSEEGTKESSINLDVALRLRELARFFGVPYRMTRECEELPYPGEAESIAQKKKWDTRERTALINSVENGFLLSIHQNYYPDSRPRGPQTFYNPTPEAAAFAAVLQRELCAALCPDSRRLSAKAPENVYIMSHAECPAVLAECGFLSNPEEARLLDTPRYREKIALVLMGAYLQYTEERNESENDLLLYGMRQ